MTQEGKQAGGANDPDLGSEAGLISFPWLCRWSDNIQTAAALVDWLGADVFGPSASRWLHMIAEDSASSVDDILRVIDVKWPGLIKRPSLEDSMRWCSAVVTDQFLTTASPRLFPYVVYETLFGRPPSKEEIEECKRLASVEDRNRFIQALTDKNSHQFVLNEQLIWCNETARGDSDFALKRARDQTTLYRQPRSVPPDFFACGTDDTGNGRNAGVICVKFNKDMNALVVDPNVSILGESLGGPRIRVESDWILTGPRVKLSAGDYLIIVHVEIEGSTDLTLDVVSDLGTVCHLSVPFAGGLQAALPLSFAQQVNNLEIRLRNNRSCEDVIKIDEIGIFRSDNQSSLLAYARDRPVIEPRMVRGTIAPSPQTPKPRKSGPINLLVSYFQHFISRYFKEFHQSSPDQLTYRFVKNTGEFDEGWYLKQYPDIQNAGIDPLKHFLDHGMKEGRLPNRHFDPLDYKEQSKSIQEDADFVHYLQTRHPTKAPRPNSRVTR